MRWESARLDELVAGIFGFNAIQIGLPHQDFLRNNRMPFRCKYDESMAGDVSGNLQQLPFAADSIDLIVLPHMLEFNANPHQVLREVGRVLVPEGHVIVCGFNPFSLWGAQRRFSGGHALAPLQGNFLSVPRLRDWFALLGMETRSGCFGCYAPAVTQEKWLRRLNFMEPAGDRWWPIAGAVYVLQAIKRVSGMRLVKPAWKARAVRAGKLIPVTQRNDE